MSVAGRLVLLLHAMLIDIWLTLGAVKIQFAILMHILATCAQTLQFSFKDACMTASEAEQQQQ